MKYDFEPVVQMKSSTPLSKIRKSNTIPNAPLKACKVHGLMKLQLEQGTDLVSTPCKKSSRLNKDLLAGRAITRQTIIVSHSHDIKALLNPDISEISQTNLDEVSDDDTISLPDNEVNIFDNAPYCIPKERIVSPLSDIEDDEKESLKTLYDSLSRNSNRLYRTEKNILRGLTSESEYTLTKDNIASHNCDGDGTFEQFEQEYKKHYPQHRNPNIRTKPLLLYPKEHLNLLVTSSRGSVDDATIFATEVNSVTRFGKGTSDDQMLPMITNELQKISIPVLTSLEERKNMIKNKYHIEEQYEQQYFGNSYSVCDNIDDQESESAIIRGYRFEHDQCNNNTNVTVRKEKHIRWTN
ncbi:hypothetical protein TPHA_0I00630 [Tetrapisispora phaffii CBS 4417]|uniref:Uncharacterized protein n=1 Tax=Tetrapisispora phaffii (strain ATCC 24235 / CBS 4417 / NBRC 1672 / NRRL Y-8282 / UCD 70-5) TaxID=1071381 RepID=G8BXE1_TETPH|nr:hypothetical protein TPHA_0I00630 [Tetrapisispora phaffii CBS 4417]CCE64569.1 hypothetical protein TPHA_0I00630 [Tetrapisispora phaffii CBS 4417]